MMTIRRAVPGDLRTVLSILHSVQGWLHREGYDQWPDGSPSLGPARIGAQIGRGEFWIVSQSRDPVAVIALSQEGDPDFWSPVELTDSAVYISKAAVLRKAAGRSLGSLVLRWAVDRAWDMGAEAARLDVWKTNEKLQAYYRRQGWRYLRTEETQGRNSGALFCRPAERDSEARKSFTLLEHVQADAPAEPVMAGSPVIVPTDDGPISATCVRVTSDRGHGITEAGWEHGSGSAPRLYAVARDKVSWFARAAWADPAARCAPPLEVTMT
jgi:ribosomal protein S18 acetylase RimI-like enzyme